MSAEIIQALIVKQLATGSYSEGAATDSIGFITIKDEEGNDRKLMVQA